MEPQIIFQDEVLLVLNKPSSWVVNRAESVRVMTVQDWIQDKFNFQNNDSEFTSRAGIVHRIDKETSGVLLVAKTESTFYELQRQFKEREVEKSYIALVHGIIGESGVINTPVGRLPWNRERFGVLAGGRAAETKYIRLAKFKFNGSQTSGDDYSLVEFFPKTGRTHQIRVHAKSINNPLVSDEFYAGRKRARGDRVWCPRLFLHAKSISFNHPVTKQKLFFESNLPDDLINALAHLAEIKGSL